jgi:hypothetical protein
MQRLAFEYKVLEAYSLEIRPSDSGMQVIVENMPTLFRPEDALTMLFAQALGRGLANVSRAAKPWPTRLHPSN